MTRPSTARFAATPRVEFRALGDSGVVVDMRSGRCWELNAVGAQIWRLLIEGESLNEISQAIAASYGMALEASVRDVTDLVRSLVEAELLMPSPQDFSPPSSL